MVTQKLTHAKSNMSSVLTRRTSKTDEMTRKNVCEAVKSAFESLPACDVRSTMDTIHESHSNTISVADGARRTVVPVAVIQWHRLRPITKIQYVHAYLVFSVDYRILFVGGGAFDLTAPLHFHVRNTRVASLNCTTSSR